MPCQVTVACWFILIDFAPFRSSTFSTKWCEQFIDHVNYIQLLPFPRNFWIILVEIFFEIWFLCESLSGFQAVISYSIFWSKAIKNSTPISDGIFEVKKIICVSVFTNLLIWDPQDSINSSISNPKDLMLRPCWKKLEKKLVNCAWVREFVIYLVLCPALYSC